MTREQIINIIDRKALPYSTKELQLVETHISWVILADEFVYKVKKPVKLGFLDFGSLEKRKHFCKQEVVLNRRLAPEMYLGILPVQQMKGQIEIGKGIADTIDYVVWMRRMDETRQMDSLLAKGKVGNREVEVLADIVSGFHSNATVIPEGEDWLELYEEFADVARVRDFVNLHFGPECGESLEAENRWAYTFLDRLKGRVEERNRLGFVIDGHGDLHTRNIFLLKKPVIFDCIEFNDAFRKLDMLNEIAFLCMDLERFGREDLSGVFKKQYLSRINCIQNPADEQLFCFYKLHRANVLLKVHIIKAQAEGIGLEAQGKEIQMAGTYMELSKAYFKMFRHY